MANLDLRDIPNIWLQDVGISGRSAGTVANNNLTGGLPIVHRFDVPDGVTGNLDFVIAEKTLILDVWVVKQGAAGGGVNTIELRNGTTNPITNAIDINVADQTRVSATLIDDARAELAAGATLRIVRTKAAGNAAARVTVLGVKVA